MNEPIMKEYDPASEHPTPEQFLVRLAIEKFTVKQKLLWDLCNYDQITQDEIAKKLGISQQSVGRQIKACETKIRKFVKQNMGAYNLLKSETEETI